MGNRIVYTLFMGWDPAKFQTIKIWIDLRHTIGSVLHFDKFIFGFGRRRTKFEDIKRKSKKEGALYW